MTLGDSFFLLLGTALFVGIVVVVVVFVVSLASWLPLSLLAKMKSFMFKVVRKHHRSRLVIGHMLLEYNEFALKMKI